MTFTGTPAGGQGHWDTTVYGDNVTAVGPDVNGNSYGTSPGGWTPNVVFSSSSTSTHGGLGTLPNVDDHAWEAGPGTPGVAYLWGATLPSPSGGYDFEFTPDAGFGARIVSWEYGPYSDTGDNETLDWEIWQTAVDTGTLLASGTNTFADTSANVLVSSGLAGHTFDMVILHVEYTGGLSGVAVDNLVFDQIPEPGTLALLAAGLMGLLAYAWRKRR